MVAPAELETKIPEAQPVTPVAQETEVAVAQERGVGIGPLEDASAELAAEAGTESEETPPVATAPVVAPTPAVPSPAVPPALDPGVRGYIERLENDNRVAQEQADLRLLQEHIDSYALRLEQQYGIDPTQAKGLAQERGQEVYRQYQAEQTSARSIADANAKALVAAQIADKYRVPIASLMEYATPTAMEQAAKSLNEQSGKDVRMAAMEKELADLKRSLVPSGQRFDSNRGSHRPAGGRDAIRDRYVEGVPITTQEKAVLFPDR